MRPAALQLSANRTAQPISERTCAELDELRRPRAQGNAETAVNCAGIRNESFKAFTCLVRVGGIN